MLIISFKFIMLKKNSALYGENTSDDVLAALLSKGRHTVVSMPRGCKHPIRAHEFQDVITDTQLQSHLKSCSNAFKESHYNTIMGMEHLNNKVPEVTQITAPIRKKQKNQKKQNKRSRNLGGGGSSTLKIIV